MKRYRVSLAGLMIAVAACGVALAALHEATEVWTVVVQTLTLGGFLGAAIGAFSRRGRVRSAWAGFALFGLCALTPLDWLTTRDWKLLPEFALVSSLEEASPLQFSARRSSSTRAAWRAQICHPLGAVGFMTFGTPRSGRHGLSAIRIGIGARVRIRSTCRPTCPRRSTRRSRRDL